MVPERVRVTLGILAGGQALRLGGTDKALVQRDGRSLVQGTLDVLGDGFAQRLVSYNGADASRLPGGLRALRDLRPGHPGPLAGIEALLAATRSDWLLTVPVDLGRIPAGLLERLFTCVDAGEGVAARDADGPQPLVALWPAASSRSAVAAALDAGERAVHRVQHILGFGHCDLAPARFGNLNTPADFDAAH